MLARLSNIEARGYRSGLAKLLVCFNAWRQTGVYHSTRLRKGRCAIDIPPELPSPGEFGGL
jgi:hypothetical protein